MCRHVGPRCAHQESVRRPAAARHCRVLPSVVQADVSGGPASPLACLSPACAVCTPLPLSLLNMPPGGGCLGWAELQTPAAGR